VPIAALGTATSVVVPVVMPLRHLPMIATLRLKLPGLLHRFCLARPPVL
jgi:hypothetical protein